jgi:hypothetical protein
MTSYRLDGLFHLRSPLSHIGETISATSYLVQEKILQEDGRTEDVFVYSGNAWRGQLRDLIAAYMLDHIGSPRLGIDAFHLLFSGGRIGGAQSVDIEQARRMRAVIPAIALLGGGVGNQILEGKLRVGNCYPLCAEAIPVLPARLHDRAAKIPYASCIFEKQHSRRDDSKIESVRRYLAGPEEQLLLGVATPPKAKEKPDENRAPDQMRIGMELVCPGVALYTWMTMRDLSPVDLGALVSGLHAFSAAPLIGGKSAIGYGLVDLDYEITDTETGETHPFVKVTDGVSLLSKPAEDAKAAYDAHLRQLYDQMLTSQKGNIIKLLGGA